MSSREQGQGSGYGGATCRHREEIREMRNYLTEIAKLITDRNRNLLTKADLLASFEKWQSNFEKKEIVLSWNDKRPDLMCAPVMQGADDCWAIALSRAISMFLQIIGSDITPPTKDELLNAIDARYLSRRGAIDRLEIAIPYVKNYVGNMIIHRRPALDSDNEEHENYEKCIVRLLAKAPLAIRFESLPSFGSHDWKTMFSPTYEDCQARVYERLYKHDGVLTGVGVELRNGVATDYWEVQESGGEDLGRGGFVRFARHQFIIEEVCELQA
ncbi:hypothetical protein AALP_AAs66918U001000 [Arabis alpina]|uniref:Peptidase C1A papain C-terminal domain-containing protein n=1 Tax=Arabis alpina TaxID=50452 RepID=A0A087G0Z4_ARAAL|nr:hypothetical protein AALP_AAs66918U001000 [Arabis alpina]